MQCEQCGVEMIFDEEKIYTSNPPMYGYRCPECGNYLYYFEPDYKTANESFCK